MTVTNVVLKENGWYFGEVRLSDADREIIELAVWFSLYPTTGDVRQIKNKSFWKPELNRVYEPCGLDYESGVLVPSNFLLPQGEEGENEISENFEVERLAELKSIVRDGGPISGTVWAIGVTAVETTRQKTIRLVRKFAMWILGIMGVVAIKIFFKEYSAWDFDKKGYVSFAFIVGVMILGYAGLWHKYLRGKEK